MRLLLSSNSRKKIFDFLINKNNCKSLKELSIKLKIPYRTIQNWRYYKGGYISENIIPIEIKKQLEILDKKEDNWGRIKGGKKTYKIILKKYGIDEIKRRQINGGKKSAKIREQNQIPVNLDID